MSELPRVWQRMLSGRRLDLLHPSPDDIDIGDIAHGLARVARWNGQTRGEHVFSVAQHSLLVEAVAGALHPGLPHRDRLAVLLHDAPEYVIGDLISPFKATVGDAYKAVEARILAAVHARFGLAPPTPALARAVKEADCAAAFIEATRIAGFDEREAAALFGRPSVDLPDLDAAVAPAPTARAHDGFLARFRALHDSEGRTGTAGA